MSQNHEIYSSDEMKKGFASNLYDLKGYIKENIFAWKIKVKKYLNNFFISSPCYFCVRKVSQGKVQSSFWSLPFTQKRNMSNLKDFHDIQRLISRFEIELTAIRNFLRKVFMKIFILTEIYPHRFTRRVLVRYIEVYNGDVGAWFLNSHIIWKRKSWIL